MGVPLDAAADFSNGPFVHEVSLERDVPFENPMGQAADGILMRTIGHFASPHCYLAILIAL